MAWVSHAANASGGRRPTAARSGGVPGYAGGLPTAVACTGSGEPGGGPPPATSPPQPSHCVSPGGSVSEAGDGERVLLFVVDPAVDEKAARRQAPKPGGREAAANSGTDAAAAAAGGSPGIVSASALALSGTTEEEATPATAPAAGPTPAPPEGALPAPEDWDPWEKAACSRARPLASPTRLAAARYPARTLAGSDSHSARTKDS